MSLSNSLISQKNSSKKLQTHRQAQINQYNDKNRLIEMATMAAMLSKHLKSSNSKQMKQNKEPKQFNNAKSKNFQNGLLNQQNQYSFGNTTHLQSSQYKRPKQNIIKQEYQDSIRKRCNSKFKDSNAQIRQSVQLSQQFQNLSSRSRRNSAYKIDSNQNAEYIKNLYQKYLGKEGKKQKIGLNTYQKQSQKMKENISNIILDKQNEINGNDINNIKQQRMIKNEQICKNLLSLYDKQQINQKQNKQRVYQDSFKKQNNKKLQNISKDQFYCKNRNNKQIKNIQGIYEKMLDDNLKGWELVNILGDKSCSLMRGLILIKKSKFKQIIKNNN